MRHSKSIIGLAASLCIAGGFYGCNGNGDQSSPATPATPGAPAAPAAPVTPPVAEVTGKWTTGDLHVHTIQSNDAQSPLATVLDQAFTASNLDWMALSNHLRVSDRDPAGTAIPGGSVAFSKGMADYEVPAVKQMQADGRYPGKLIFSAFEWDMPTHDHMNVGIFSGSPALAPALKAANEFEYFFTNRADTLFNPVDVAAWNAKGPRAFTTHADALLAFNWLKTNYPDSSYALINHPSRNPGKYTAANYRELNDLAPNIVFAVEGMVGNQMEPDRGGYNSAYIDANLKSRTYGGVDYVVAQVGGIWDALLGDGRRFWNLANSDHHFKTAGGQFSSGYFPGEYARNYLWMEGTGIKGLLDSLRAGKSFSVFGDLINALDFNVAAGSTKREMGGELMAKAGDKVTVTIRFKSPDRNRFEYPLDSGVNVNVRPTVDHIDLIAGDVTRRPAPGTPEYSKETNDSTKVIATFTKTDWKLDKDGYNTVTYTFTAAKSQYFRLRGTNLGLNVPGETANGNPLPDTKTDLVENAARFDAINARNYNDLWFYSNPVFVTVASGA